MTHEWRSLFLLCYFLVRHTKSSRVSHRCCFFFFVVACGELDVCKAFLLRKNHVCSSLKLARLGLLIIHLCPQQVRRPTYAVFLFSVLFLLKLVCVHRHLLLFHSLCLVLVFSLLIIKFSFAWFRGVSAVHYDTSDNCLL